MNDNNDITKVNRALEICVQNKIAAIFEKAIMKKYDLLSFTKLFLESNLYSYIYDDFTIYSQAPGYALCILCEEVGDDKLKSISLPDAALYDLSVAYWMGFLFAEWHYIENISGLEILCKYNLSQIYNSF